MLKLQNISFNYPESDKNELSNISLSIKSGEKISIIGESGSGKSTLLKIIDGQFDYDGKVEFNKGLLKKRSDVLLPGIEEIKLIDQHFDLYKNITVRENLMIHLRAYKTSFQKVRIKKLTNVFQLKNIIDKKVEHLSGGEMQRVAISNALTTIPEVVLLDEPFNNLDYNLRKRAMDFLNEEIIEYGSTAILVSHRPDEILSFSDKIVVMRKGKIIQKGMPEDVFFKPKTEYTAGLLGEFNLSETIENNTHILNNKSFFRPIDVSNLDKKELLRSEFLGDKYKITLKDGTIAYSLNPML